MFILVWVIKLIANTILLAELPASSPLGGELVQVVSCGVPRDRLVLGTGLGHVVSALLVAVQATVLRISSHVLVINLCLHPHLTPEPCPDDAPQYRVAQVAVCGCGVVVLLKPVRVCVGPSCTTLGCPAPASTSLTTQQQLNSRAFVYTAAIVPRIHGWCGHLGRVGS